MNTALLRLGLVLSVLADASLGFGQATAVVDLKTFRPREVKSTVFSLASSQDLHIQAIGADSTDSRGTFSWVTAMWKGNATDRREPWMGNAWILDLNTRRVVWELSSADTERGHRSTRTFTGAVRLPAGKYEAFYSAFPTTYWTDDKGAPSTAQRFVKWLTDEGFDEFRLTIHGGSGANATDAERARRSLEDGAIVALRGDGGQTFRQAGFVVARPTQVEIYAEGEAREHNEFDAGWIINADTREKVWKLTWQSSAPAGGAQKNRMARVTRTFPPGRYAAFYATDDSHDASEWNSAPPHDPYAWGLVLRVLDADARAAVKPFAYEHVPAASTIVALTKIGDRESRTRGFTLNRAMAVRVYALGESSDDRLVDYGWITNSATGQKVWEMRYAETEPAGGDAKNRGVDRVIHLEKGSYILHYVSDDSHSFNDWNAAAPPDALHWGITLLGAEGLLDRSAIGEASGNRTPR